VPQGPQRIIEIVWPPWSFRCRGHCATPAFRQRNRRSGSGINSTWGTTRATIAEATSSSAARSTKGCSPVPYNREWTSASHCAFAFHLPPRARDSGSPSDRRRYNSSICEASVTPSGAAEEWMRADLGRAVRLEEGPLFAHALLRVGDDRCWFYFRYHHILLDGFGQVLYLRRVAEVYTALEHGRVPVVSKFASLRELLAEEQDYRQSPQYEDRPHVLGERSSDSLAGGGLASRTTGGVARERAAQPTHALQRRRPAAGGCHLPDVLVGDCAGGSWRCTCTGSPRPPTSCSGFRLAAVWAAGAVVDAGDARQRAPTAAPAQRRAYPWRGRAPGGDSGRQGSSLPALSRRRGGAAPAATVAR
jgi:hypothetical protein